MNVQVLTRVAPIVGLIALAGLGTASAMAAKC